MSRGNYPRPTKEQLEKVYLTGGNSMGSTAFLLGTSFHQVNIWLTKYKIPRRNRSEAMKAMYRNYRKAKS